MSLKNYFENKHTHWERFQALHLLFVTGGHSGPIMLHPDSLEALTIEMAPRKRGEVFDPPLITGAATHAGYVSIVSDPGGVKL